MRPEYAEIKGKKYKINTDYRVALECNKIAEDGSIGDTERALAIIYKLFGSDGIDNKDLWNDFFEMSIKYLKCGKNAEQKNNEEPNIDFEQDKSYIEASFRSDYGIDLDKANMHWWAYFDLLNGLTENCVLNRVRYVRDFDISEIKDAKEKAKWKKQKEQVALKKKNKPLTEKQRESANKFYEISGIKR